MRAPRPLFWIIAVTLAAAFLRFFQLHTFPVGFHFDEAADVVDIWRLGPNFHPIYFTANNGREPLYFYWAAIFVDVLGDVPFALRLSSAFVGVATIPAVYFCFSQMLRQPEGIPRARRIAVFAAAGCAFLFFHLNFSRIGLRTITLPFMECLAFGLLWRAQRTGRRRDFIFAGLTGGLCLYTYTAARLLVLALAVYGMYWLISQRRVNYFRELIAAALVFAIVALPLAIYALRNSAEFFQRTTGVAVLNRAEVLQNTGNILEMFFIRGSINGAHNIIGMPLFDWPMASAFITGLALLVVRLRRPVYVFIVIWIIFVAAASAFSPDAPYYIRLTALIPPTVVIPALALARLPDWLGGARSRAREIQFWAHERDSPSQSNSLTLWKRVRVRINLHQPPFWSFLPSAALMLTAAGSTYNHYFNEWGPSNDTYFWMMQDKVDASAGLNGWARQGNQVFLAPLFAQDWTFEALTRNEPIQSFDVKYCIALPPRGQDAVYAFPPYDVTQPGALLARLPGSARELPLLNTLQQPILIQVRVPGGDLPAPSADLVGNFSSQIGLVRVDGLPQQPVTPGSTVRFTLVWQSLAPTPDDYTVFIHADDTAHQRRVQQDSPPCGGTFATNRWFPGDQVLDRHELTVPKDAPTGTYQVTTGLYVLPGPHNATLTGTQSVELPIGTFQVQ